VKKLQVLSLALIFALVCNSTVLAFHVPPWDTGHNSFQGDNGDEDTDPGEDGPIKCGSPVEVSSGNFIYKLRSLIIAGVGPVIDTSLMYNSRDMRQGQFGNGWVSPYDQRVIETTDGDGMFAIHIQPNGKRERYKRNPDGSYKSPPHTFSILVKNSDSTFTIREREGVRLEFNTNGRLTSVVDRNNNALSFNYDSMGFLTGMTDASGRTASFTKGANGRTESISDPAGRTFRYTYDTFGNLKSFTDPLGNATTYEYDSKNNLIALIDPRGNTLIRATYDSEGRASTLVDGAETWTFTYQPAIKRTTKRDSAGNTWTYDYNDSGNITKVTDPLGGTELYVFDQDLNVTEFINKNGSKTTYTYDAAGNLLTITDALGGVRTKTYEPVFNLLLTEKDPNGKVTRFEYDSRGNLTKIIDALNNSIQYQYDSKGQLVRITDAFGKSTNFTYDANGNLAQVTDPLGHSSRATYDDLGRIATATDREGRTAQFTYDDSDRLTRMVNQQGGASVFEYDASDNLIAVTSPNGERSTSEFDSINRRVRSRNAANQITTYVYNKKDNLLSRTDPKGQVLNYTYDKLERLVKKARPDGAVNYTYDRVGNLLTVVDSDSSLTYVFDSLDRITEARTAATSAQPATIIKFTYDANGNRKTMTDPSGGVTTYECDALSRLTSITDPSGHAHTFSYDALSRRTRLDRPAGVSTTYTYDDVSRLLSLAHQSTAGNISFNYVYDRIGNRVSLADATGQHSFSYNSLYQLTAASHSSGIPAESYSYDSVGNRLSSHLSSSYTYTAVNRLSADASFDYVYDANGNMIRKTDRANGQITTFTYDPEDQLTRIDFPNNTSTSYRYDGIGRRIEKDVNGQVTHYIYDGPDILGEYSADGTLNARYTHGPGDDEVLAVLRGGTYSVFESDALGSVVRVTTGATVVASFVYDSFGRIISQTGTAVEPYTFQGRELDQESGLYYFRSRYYDPQTGRFLNEDPVGYLSGPNFYEFVGNNPLTYGDYPGTGKKKIAQFLVKTVKGTYKWVRSKTAQQQLRKGKNIYTQSRKESRTLTKKTFPESKVKTDSPHQEGWRPHSQPNPRPKGTGKGHTFYSGLVGLSACLSFEGHFGDNFLTNTLDVFNPLTLPHDILTLPDLWDDLTTGWDEVPTAED
jgi:RHS repeat-associated protein